MLPTYYNLASEFTLTQIKYGLQVMCYKYQGHTLYNLWLIIQLYLGFGKYSSFIVCGGGGSKTLRLLFLIFVRFWVLILKILGSLISKP